MAEDLDLARPARLNPHCCALRARVPQERAEDQFDRLCRLVVGVAGHPLILCTACARIVRLDGRLRSIRTRVGEAYAALEDKPLVVVVVAAGATVAVAAVLASELGWPRFLRVAADEHSWGWLIVCAAAELVAYGGYALTLRDVARAESGDELDLPTSAKTVVAGFGVFAATRSSGGFAVDYWAFGKPAPDRRDAVQRVLALGLLEYLILGIATLIASALLLLRIDGHASLAVTLPGLSIVPLLAIGVWLTSPDRARPPAPPRAAGCGASSPTGSAAPSSCGRWSRALSSTAQEWWATFSTGPGTSRASGPHSNSRTAIRRSRFC